MSEKRSIMYDVLSIYVPAFFIFIGISIVSPILALYAASFNVSYTLISLAISIYAFGRFLADLPVGMMIDRFGRKPLMIVGIALLTVTAFMNALARNFWEFLFYRFLQGIGSSMWMVSRTTMLADILKPEERGRILGYFQAFMLLGSSFGPTVGGIVATLWGIKAPFYFYALTGAISLILTIVLIRETPATRVKHDAHQYSLQTFKRVLSNRSYSMACLVTFLAFFMRTGIRSMMIPLYADSVIGLDEAAIGTVISYASIMNLVMAIPMGHAIDYFGRKLPIVSSLLVTALSSILFPFTLNYLQISLAAVLLGIGTSGTGQAPLAMATDATVNEPHGISMGLYRLFGDIGFMAGPVILGIIADGYGLRMPFHSMTALILVNAVLVQLLAIETYHKNTKITS